MKKHSATFLLAGTAIGSGMISLPMVLAKFGIFNSCLIMLAFSVLTYITALIRSELNLNSQAEASLREVGIAFGRPLIGKIGDFLLKLLSFALLSAYMFGGASIVNSFTENVMPFPVILSLFAATVALMFTFASDIIVHINKFLFCAMFSILVLLVIALFLQTPITFIPQQSPDIGISEWATLAPIIFTSFGFQGSIHSMTKFCGNDRKMIKHACLWGSLIPAIVYIIWTAAILLVVANTDSHFFGLMLEGKATDVGELVKVLSLATSSKSIQLIIWTVSLLAILTSVLGVGLALLDIFQQELKMTRWKSVSMVTIIPALISMFIPNAFIRILNISGVILAIMAIVVPIFISHEMRKRHPKSDLLVKRNSILFITLVFGIALIALGIFEIQGVGS